MDENKQDKALEDVGHPSPHLTQQIEQLLQQMRTDKATMDYIKPEMLPGIDLYMDQVTTFMDEHLGNTKRYERDKILTKTMINNYAKNNLLPPPEKKKYSGDHLLLLTFIYYLKSMLSMADIEILLKPVRAQYFKNDSSDLGLNDIYNEVFKLQKNFQPEIMEDIFNKFKLSQNSFAHTDPDQADTLHSFAFVCSLCYDIFLKKQLVEKIIDTMNRQDEPEKKKKK